MEKPPKAMEEGDHECPLDAFGRVLADKEIRLSFREASTILLRNRQKQTHTSFLPTQRCTGKAGRFEMSLCLEKAEKKGRANDDWFWYISPMLRDDHTTNYRCALVFLTTRFFSERHC